MKWIRTFEDFYYNCELIRRQYPNLLSPFFNARIVRKWKVLVYTLDIKEYQKNLICEYLNLDIEKDILTMEMERIKWKKQ